MNNDIAEIASDLPDPLVGGSPLLGSKGLEARVAPVEPTRINPFAVKSVFMGSAAVLSCAFVFAFVISPNLQAQARAKAQSENQRTPPGSVKPSDVLEHRALIMKHIQSF